MEKLLVLSTNPDLDITAYQQLNVQVFTAQSIQPKDYAQITIMLGWQPDLSTAVLESPNSALKWVQTLSAGVDYLPLAKLQAHHILVTNMSGIHAVPISQTVILYALYFMRDFPILLDNARQATWTPRPALANALTLEGTTWTIFGTGHIGSELARLLQAFHVRVNGVNRTGHPVANFEHTFAQADWQQAVASADVVVNVMPLTNETTHFYNQAFFDYLQNLYLFINVGRGKSVDTSALVEALHTHHVQHAALDVFEQEPLAPDNPLWQLSNVILTPHYSPQMKHLGRAQHKLFLGNLQKFLSQDTSLKNQVDLTKGY